MGAMPEPRAPRTYELSDSHLNGPEPDLGVGDGWYRDPIDETRVRYWESGAWTPWVHAVSETEEEGTGFVARRGVYQDRMVELDVEEDEMLVWLSEPNRRWSSFDIPRRTDPIWLLTAISAIWAGPAALVQYSIDGLVPALVAPVVAVVGVVAVGMLLSELRKVYRRISIEKVSTASVQRAGWWPDPTKRYQLRRFDGKDWTGTVLWQGSKRHDPLNKRELRHAIEPGRR